MQAQKQRHPAGNKAGWRRFGIMLISVLLCGGVCLLPLCIGTRHLFFHQFVGFYRAAIFYCGLFYFNNIPRFFQGLCRHLSRYIDRFRHASQRNFYENVCIFPSYNRFCEIVRIFRAQQNAPAAGKFRPQGRCGVCFNFPWLYTVVECWVNLAMAALTSGIFSGNRRHFMP